MSKSTFITTLKDGTKILIRLLKPEDKKEIAAGFQKLSPKSRRFRFVCPINRLLPEQLSYLTEIDNIHHLAYGARDISSPQTPGIGIARYVQLKGEKNTAEFAVTVIDEYQGRGLGKIFIRALQDAAFENGIRTLRGYIHKENIPMLHLAESIGAELSQTSSALIRADLPVSQSSGFNSKVNLIHTELT